MIGYLQILGQEVYKIIFLLVPILVSVAMIVWLTGEYGVWCKKEEVLMLLALLDFFKL